MAKVCHLVQFDILRYEGQNIGKIANSPYWLHGASPSYANEAVMSLLVRKLHVVAVWRTSKSSNILTLISQRSYQIRRKSSWHPLAPDKTFLQ